MRNMSRRQSRARHESYVRVSALGSQESITRGKLPIRFRPQLFDDAHRIELTGEAADQVALFAVADQERGVEVASAFAMRWARAADQIAAACSDSTASGGDRRSGGAGECLGHTNESRKSWRSNRVNCCRPRSRRRAYREIVRRIAPATAAGLCRLRPCRSRHWRLRWEPRLGRRRPR